MQRAKCFSISILLIVVTACTAVMPTHMSAERPLRELIVYSTLRPFNWDLYLFETPGGKPQRLTTDPALDYDPVFSPDGRWVVFCSERRGNPDLYALDLKNGGEPKLLTNTDAMEDQPTFSLDGRFLAFVSTRDGNADIFVMPFRPEGPDASAQAVNLTKHPGGDFRPAFSRDGSKIAFSSDRDSRSGTGSGSRASEIYVMDADGSNVKKLTESKGWDGSPTWSADGKTIYFYSERDGSFRIWRMNADGSDPRPVSPKGLNALSPALSRSGRVAFTINRGGQWQIVSLRADSLDERLESDTQQDYWGPAFDPKSDRMICYGNGPVEKGTMREASHDPGTLSEDRFLVAGGKTEVQLPDRRLEMHASRTYFPALSPNGNEIIGTAVLNHDSYYLVAYHLDGTGLRKIFKPASGGAWYPRLSADGRWIVFTIGPTFGRLDENADIWKAKSDGSGAVNLTGDSKANDACPDISPDGSRIVFRSGRDGNKEIYLMNADGTNLRRLTNDPATDTMPTFSPKGDQIAFSSNRDGDFEIYTLQIGPDGAPGELRRITHNPGADMHPRYSPDGKWLVFVSEQGGISDEEPLIPIFNPQPYGEIWTVRLQDGMQVRLTHNKWEDGPPMWGKAQD